MAGQQTIGRAYAERLAQRLVGPARALLGYQELIVETVREAGPAGAVDDLEKVLIAARDLETLVGRLLADGRAAGGADAEAKVRHDLRTPLNAILGYSEMVLEDFAADLPPEVAGDIGTVRRQATVLLGQIDAIVRHASGDGPALGPELDADDPDLTIAARLAHTIDAPPLRPDGQPGRILVVDDLKSNRDLLARRLRRDGHTVAKARSGAHALEVLQTQEFDLLLVDVLMPDMNGIELLRRVKADPRLHDVPVLMISGLQDEAAVLRCIAGGAEDYLPKPVDTVLLRARIQACLERSRWRERERRYRDRIRAEMDRANALLHAILPGPVVRRLNGGETVIADRFEQATIIFADIVDFSRLAAQTAPAMLLNRLDRLFSRFDALADATGVEKIKTIGDAYMAAAGIPAPRPDHAVSALSFARAILAEAARDDQPRPGTRLRVGIHSGPVIAGLIGRKRFVYDVWGHTVNVASRLEASGVPGKIHISESTLSALGDGNRVEARREIEMKGLGPMSTYLVSP